MPELVEVAPVPPVPLRDLLTYRVPQGLGGPVEPGMRVRVPLGRQVRTGVVAGFAERPPPGEVRSVLEVLDATPFLPADLLELCRWTARYYLVSLAEVIAAIATTRLASRKRRPRTDLLPFVANATLWPVLSERSSLSSLRCDDGVTPGRFVGRDASTLSATSFARPR